MFSSDFVDFICMNYYSELHSYVKNLSYMTFEYDFSKQTCKGQYMPPRWNYKGQVANLFCSKCLLLCGFLESCGILFSLLVSFWRLVAAVNILQFFNSCVHSHNSLILEMLFFYWLCIELIWIMNLNVTVICIYIQKSYTLGKLILYSYWCSTSYNGYFIFMVVIIHAFVA